jgi:hypothetical protein
MPNCCPHELGGPHSALCQKAARDAERERRDRRDRRYQALRYGALAAAVALFAAAMGFFTWRDHRAVDRCEALGGVTWDSGQHCVIHPERVVDTHDRTWG